MKKLIIILTVILTSCTLSHEMKNAILDGISNGLEKHNQREAEWREYVEIRKLVEKKLR